MNKSIETFGKLHKITYKNYRGEISVRNIKINNFNVGYNQYHKEYQLLMDAVDLEKNENRVFAVKDILRWHEE